MSVGEVSLKKKTTPYMLFSNLGMPTGHATIDVALLYALLGDNRVRLQERRGRKL